MQWLFRWLHKRQRDLDMKILWPCCIAHAPSLQEARGAFFLHTRLDPAWLELSDEQVIEFIEGHCN
jgi:hypothetical protein